SRHARVEIDGVTMGETRRPILLFETGLPTRYYIPKLDARMDLLEPSESVTRCPYKGVARYWSARVGDKLVKDIVWSYPAPIPECPKIENLLSFYNERVLVIYSHSCPSKPYRDSSAKCESLGRRNWCRNCIILREAEYQA